MGEPLPLPAAEIKAWCEMTRIRLEPWEFRAIRAIDLAVLRGRKGGEEV